MPRRQSVFHQEPVLLVRYQFRNTPAAFHYSLVIVCSVKKQPLHGRAKGHGVGQFLQRPGKHDS